MSAVNATIPAEAQPSALTGEQAVIYNRLVEDATPWNMADIAVNLDVKSQTVRSWRKLALATKRDSPQTPHPNELPPSESPTGAAMWRAGTIRRWAIQTGRMSPTGEPKRLKPPGRPRSSGSKAA